MKVLLTAALLALPVFVLADQGMFVTVVNSVSIPITSTESAVA